MDLFGKKPVSFFKDLRDSVIDSKSSVPEVLRKAKLLGSYLGNTDFKQWVDYELNGYPEGVDIPPYRKIQVPALGTFSAPFGRVVSGMILPSYNLDHEIKHFAEIVVFSNSIKEIEEHSKREDGMRRTWPAEVVLLARDKIEMADGSVLVDAHQPLSKANFESIIDAVRNRLLDFLLQLQELNSEIVESEEAIPDLEKNKVGQIFNITIQGDNTVLASGDTVTQNVEQTNNVNDQKQLFDYLKSLGIPEGELSDLSEAIEQDGKPKDKSIGPRVHEWMGKMMEKTYQGAFTIAVNTAPQLIYKAFANYYGWE